MTKRHFYLDLLRVFAISAVVLLHCINTIIITPWLVETSSWKIAIVLNEFSRAGVPLFLMISGYLMLSDERSADFAFFYKKRLPRILIPLALWCVIYYISDALMGAAVSFKGFFTALIYNGIAYHMWFVYLLLGIYLITPFLKRLVDTLTKKALLWLALIILFPTAIRPILNLAFSINLYLFDPLVEGYLGFFLVGYILGTVEFNTLTKDLIMLGGIVGAAVGIFGNIGFCEGGVINPVFNGGYMINHYLLAASLFILAKTLDEKLTVPNALRKLTAKLSDISFGVYWIHVLVISLTTKFVVFEASPIVLSCVHFVIVMLASTLIMLTISFIKPIKRFIM